MSEQSNLSRENPWKNTRMISEREGGSRRTREVMMPSDSNKEVVLRSEVFITREDFQVAYRTIDRSEEGIYLPNLVVAVARRRGESFDERVWMEYNQLGLLAKSGLYPPERRRPISFRTNPDRRLETSRPRPFARPVVSDPWLEMKRSTQDPGHYELREVRGVGLGFGEETRVAEGEIFGWRGRFYRLTKERGEQKIEVFKDAEGEQPEETISFSVEIRNFRPNLNRLTGDGEDWKQMTRYVPVRYNYLKTEI